MGQATQKVTDRLTYRHGGTPGQFTEEEFNSDDLFLLDFTNANLLDDDISDGLDPERRIE